MWRSWVSVLMAVNGLLWVSIFASAAERPNVILILTDDQGYGDLGVHGNPRIATPHLDKFAQEGIQFSRFYCGPVCSPTRASLLTGRYHYRTGVIHTSRGGAKMDTHEITLAEVLLASGWQTGIFGKWHLGDNYPLRPQEQGVQECLIHKSGGISQAPDLPNSYFNPILWENGQRVQKQGYCTDIFFDAALQFMEKHREQPFFVYLPINTPHTPLEIAPEYTNRYRDQGLDEITAQVYGMISNLDDNVGRLLAKLDELKLRNNTIVIFLTDNGPQQERYTGGLRGRKGSTYEGGIRVPCFLQWPGKLAGGRKLEFQAAHIDWLPTLLSLLGVPRPAEVKLDGISFAPELVGTRPTPPERLLFFQCHRGLTPKPGQNCAVISSRYKLLGSPAAFSREDFKPESEATWELYDLQTDPGEQTNLITQQPELAKQYQQAYRAWFEDVKQSRNFLPGRIVIGHPKEPVTYLCRIQDANADAEAPSGWLVEILKTARYELQINTETDEAGELHISWQGMTQQFPLAQGQRVVTLPLPAGEGLLDVWFQPAGKSRPRLPGNTLLGDVTIRRNE